jgi:hypothetical protein
MSELSPVAIAVDDALAACIQLQGEMILARPLAAAALRAAALYCKQDRIRLLAVADELEAT